MPQVGSLDEIKELRRGSILRKCAGWVIEAEVNERLTARRAALARQLWRRERTAVGE
jgi:hypothetical protein